MSFHRSRPGYLGNLFLFSVSSATIRASSSWSTILWFPAAACAAWLAACAPLCLPSSFAAEYASPPGTWCAWWAITVGSDLAAWCWATVGWAGEFFLCVSSLALAPPFPRIMISDKKFWKVGEAKGRNWYIGISVFWVVDLGRTAMEGVFNGLWNRRHFSVNISDKLLDDLKISIKWDFGGESGRRNKLVWDKEGKRVGWRVSRGRRFVVCKTCMYMEKVFVWGGGRRKEGRMYVWKNV